MKYDLQTLYKFAKTKDLFEEDKEYTRKEIDKIIKPLKNISTDWVLYSMFKFMREEPVMITLPHFEVTYGYQSQDNGKIIGTYFNDYVSALDINEKIKCIRNGTKCERIVLDAQLKQEYKVTRYVFKFDKECMEKYLNYCLNEVKGSIKEKEEKCLKKLEEINKIKETLGLTI